MNGTTPITVYFPDDMVSDINAHLETAREASRARQISRSDVIRELVEIGLRERARRR